MRELRANNSSISVTTPPWGNISKPYQCIPTVGTGHAMSLQPIESWAIATILDPAAQEQLTDVCYSHPCPLVCGSKKKCCKKYKKKGKKRCRKCPIQ